jgi:hypothetical protein
MSNTKRTIKVQGSAEVLSNLPIIPNPKVDDGLNRVYPYDVKVYDKEVKSEKRDGTPNYSMFAGTTRPYLAVYYKAINTEGRDKVHVQRFFPTDNSTSKGDAISEDDQINSLQTDIAHILHIWQSVQASPFCKTKRTFVDIDLDIDTILSNDVDVRIKAFTDLYNDIAKQFMGKAKELSIFEVTKDKFEIPMWLKLILDWRNKDFTTPQYVGNGYLEPIRYDGKKIVPAQIFIDPSKKESILRTVSANNANDASKESVTNIDEKIGSDLNL